MKSFIFSSMLLLCTIVLNAQQPEHKEGPPKLPPIEERWKHDDEKLASLALTPTQTNDAKTIFLRFYKNMDALMEKNNEQRPPREEVEELVNQRNEAVKKLLTKVQLEKFASLEKSLMPPPPGKKPGDKHERQPPTTK